VHFLNQLTSLRDYFFPHVILVSKNLQNFEVNPNEELSEVVKPSHEINNRSFIKMGFVKVNDSWLNKEDDSAGTSTGPSTTADPSDGVGLMRITTCKH